MAVKIDTEEKVYNVNGVLKKETEVTPKDLDYICKHHRVDAEFVERYVSYLSRDALFNISNNDESLVKEVLDVMKGFLDGDNDVERRKAYYFFDSVLTSREILPQWVATLYGDIINWKVVNLFHDANSFLDNHFERIIERVFVRNRSFQKLISEELMKHLSDPTGDSKYLELKGFVDKAGFTIEEYLIENAVLNDEIIEMCGSNYSIKKLLSNDNTHIDQITKRMNRNNDEHIYEFTSSRRFTEDELEKYHEYINWIMIGGGQQISEGFLQKHKRRLDWNRVSKRQKMSAKFIEDNIEVIALDKVIRNGEMDFDELLKIRHLLTDRQKIVLAQREDATEEYLVGLIESGVTIRELPWFSITRNPNMSEDFLKKYRNNIDWHVTSWSRALSREFVMENIDIFDTDDLIKNVLLPIDLIEELKTMVETKNKF